MDKNYAYIPESNALMNDICIVKSAFLGNEPLTMKNISEIMEDKYEGIKNVVNSNLSYSNMNYWEARDLYRQNLLKEYLYLIELAEKAG